MNEVVSLLAGFPNALLAGVLMAGACSILGVFVILKRVVFIGITLAEVSTCGVALAFMLGLPPFAGAVALTLGAVALLSAPFENRHIPRDAVLGVLFVLSAALAILLVSRSGFGLMEVKALLYGDLILASTRDVWLLAGIFLPVMTVFFATLRPTLNAFLDRETARVLGGRPILWETLYFAMLGVAVSAASRIAGALLVFCYLAVIPATALLLSRRFGRVLALAAFCGVAATLGGLYVSFRYDTPTNQTICAVACSLFLLSALTRGLYGAVRA